MKQIVTLDETWVFLNEIKAYLLFKKCREKKTYKTGSENANKVSVNTL